jgi:DNA repair protein RecO
MSLVSTEAFVINGFNYGDTSKIVTFYSLDAGKFSAVVKGVRSFKSKYCGIYDNINLVRIFLNKKENRSLQVISKAECINTFKNVKGNLDKLNSAFQILELANKTTIEYDLHPEIYFLIKDIILLLEHSNDTSELAVLLFSVKLAYLLGIEPVILKNESKNECDFMVSDRTFTSDKILKLSDEEYDLLQILRNYNFELNEKVSCTVYIVEKLLKVYESFFINNFHRYILLKSKKIKEELNRSL